MKLEKYEKVTRILAILIMLIAIELWFHYFHELADVFIEYDIQYSLWEIFKGWYAQILQVTAEVLGIILLLAFRKKGLPIILGVCALVIALECALDAYLLLVEYKQIFNADLADFIGGVISLVIAGMLFFNAILYSVRATNSATLIKYATIALILLQVFAVIVEIRGGSTFQEIVYAREYDYPSYLLLFLVLHMSMSKFTKRTSYTGIIKTSINDLRNSLMVEGVGIDRNIAQRFSDYNENGLWCDAYSFILTTFQMEKYSMSMTAVGGDMVGTISSVENNSGMNVFRFNITGVWFDNDDPNTCDLMRFYGTNGLFVQFIVRDSQTYLPAGVPKFGAANLSSREEGTSTHGLRVKIAAFKAFVKKHVSAAKGYVGSITGRLKKRKDEEE